MKQSPLEEKWIRWEPIKGLSPKYFVDSILDDLKEFSIILSDERDKEKYAKMTFDCLVLSHRHTDESHRIKTIAFLDEKYENNFYSDWTFFIVENSKYLSWVIEETRGFNMPKPVTHYAFIDSNSILDVIAMGEPKIELIEKE